MTTKPHIFTEGAIGMANIRKYDSTRGGFCVECVFDRYSSAHIDFDRATINKRELIIKPIGVTDECEGQKITTRANQKALYIGRNKNEDLLGDYEVVKDNGLLKLYKIND